MLEETSPALIYVAGTRATADCEPRQVRKEAAVAITDVCRGKTRPSFAGAITGSGNKIVLFPIPTSPCL